MTIDINSSEIAWTYNLWGVRSFFCSMFICHVYSSIFIAHSKVKRILPRVFRQDNILCKGKEQPFFNQLIKWIISTLTLALSRVKTFSLWNTFDGNGALHD